MKLRVVICIFDGFRLFEFEVSLVCVFGVICRVGFRCYSVQRKYCVEFELVIELREEELKEVGSLSRGIRG